MATKTQTTDTASTKNNTHHDEEDSQEWKETASKVAWTVGLAFLSGLGTAAGAYAFNQVSDSTGNTPKRLDEDTNILPFREAL